MAELLPMKIVNSMLFNPLYTAELFHCHLLDAGEGYDGVFLCCPFSHEMTWLRSWT